MTFLEQHLSDEAVAACADGVLSGAAQDRAARHIATCGECAQAVRVQREAVWALRAAPAPPLPAHLLARLRDVPQTTPISALPPVVTSDGSGLFAGYAPMAGFAPAPVGERGAHRGRTLAIAAAAVALTGAITAGAVVAGTHDGNGAGSQPGGSTGFGSHPQQPQFVRHVHH